MPARENPIDRGRDNARRLGELVRRELRNGRVDRGLTQGEVGRAVRLSASEVSRIERGLVHVDLETASVMAAAVGLELSVRAYPSGQPLRDRAHAALLEKLRGELHRSLSFRTEVPMPRPGDLRAWDAVIRGGGPGGSRWVVPVEAETHPNDRQALERRLELKMRDADMDVVIVVLSNTRHNRDFVRAGREALAERFPVPGGRAIELRRAGVPPNGSAVIVL